VQGRGLEVAGYFTRVLSSDPGATALTVELKLQNFKDGPLTNVEVSPEQIESESNSLVAGFPKIGSLEPGDENIATVQISVDVSTKKDVVKFSVVSEELGACECSLKVPVGETLRPFNEPLALEEFDSQVAALSGMNEKKVGLQLPTSATAEAICSGVKHAANVAICDSEDTAWVRFYAQTLAEGNPVFIRVCFAPTSEEHEHGALIVNSGDLMLSEQLIDELKISLQG
jgi:hypothetical protein